MKQKLPCPDCGSEVRQDPWNLISKTRPTACERCGTALKATVNERSTFIALAIGGAVWFAAFVVTNAAGYPLVAATAANAASIVGVAVSAYRYAICLKAVT